MKKLFAIVLPGVIFCTGVVPGATLVHEARAQTVTTVAGEEADVAPYNLVIVLLDVTVSFLLPSKDPGTKGRVFAQEALHLVQQYLRDAAKQPRRRDEGHDVYAIVAIDAASQVVWTGSREQLAELTTDTLKQRLAARAQFKWCTDIEAAFNEAVNLLHKYQGASEKYVFVFSDFINEPPHGAWDKCAAPSGEPPKGIEWSALKGTRLGMYFAGKDYRYRPDLKWPKEIERRGLQAEFLDAVQTLSAGVTLNPPPPAVYKPTEEQVAVAQARVEGLSNTVVRAAASVVGLGIVSIAALFAWIIWSRRRMRDARRV